MYNNNISRGTFFNNIPVFSPLVDSKEVTDIEVPDFKHLEADVEIEEEYIEYLLHYKKDISHLIDK